MGRKRKPIHIMGLLRSLGYFFQDLYYDYPYALYHNIRRLYKNIVFFLPHIIKMRDFDYHYQLHLFCDGLEYLARGLKRHDHCVMSDKNYRRCLFAARRLRNAYEDNSYKDKSYRRLSDKNPITFVPHKNGMSQMIHIYGNSEDYYDKMFRLITKRIAKTQEKKKVEAFAYLQKHIEHFWD